MFSLTARGLFLAFIEFAYILREICLTRYDYRNKRRFPRCLTKINNWQCTIYVGVREIRIVQTADVLFLIAFRPFDADIQFFLSYPRWKKKNMRSMRTRTSSNEIDILYFTCVLCSVYGRNPCLKSCKYSVRPLAQISSSQVIAPYIQPSVIRVRTGIPAVNRTHDER